MGVFGLAVSGAAAYEQQIRAMSKALGDRIAGAGTKTVAVVDFTDLSGSVTELGRFLAEEMSAAFVEDARGFRVIDRTHLKAILQEHKLAATGIIDPQTARRLGEIAGVEVLVTGTITPFGDTVRLTAKALNTTTAEVIAAKTEDIPKTKAIEELLTRGLGGSRPASPAGSGGGAAAPVGGAGAGLPTFETESYRMIVESVSKERVFSQVIVRLSVAFESVADRPVQLSLGDAYSSSPRAPFLLDERGERWYLNVPDPLGVISREQAVTLSPGERLRTSITFGTEGSGGGMTFTFTCPENSPNSRRRIVIHNLKTQ